MRTTIELKDSLFREVKMVAAKRGMSLKDLFTRAIEKCIDEETSGVCRMSEPPIVLEDSVSIEAISNQEIAAMEDDAMYTKVTKAN